jgi:hypothetical protein
MGKRGGGETHTGSHLNEAPRRTCPSHAHAKALVTAGCYLLCGHSPGVGDMTRPRAHTTVRATAIVFGSTGPSRMTMTWGLQQATGRADGSCTEAAHKQRVATCDMCATAWLVAWLLGTQVVS